MAEIKSAIELAMERTKNLVMDDEEKQKLLIQDAENRLKAIVRRFLDGAVYIDDFQNQYDKIELTEEAKRALLVDIVVSGFDVGEDAKLFDLLHVADRKMDNRLKDQLEIFQRRFSEAMEKKSGEVRKRVLARLKKMGITGSALEPNLVAWDEWKEAVTETKEAFRSQLQQWKDEVRAVTV
jgi:predicted oxidoreductase (fatty acid repression mutant protein)